MANEYQPQSGDGFKSADVMEPLARTTRNRQLLTILMVITVFLGVGAVGLYAYNKGKQKGLSTLPPVIQAKDGPTKVRPDNPGGMTVPNRDKEVFNRFDKRMAQQKVEIILSAPEKPLTPISSIRLKSAEKISRSNANNQLSEVTKTSKPRQTEIEAKIARGTPAKPLIRSETSAAGAKFGNNKDEQEDTRYRVQLASLRSLSAVRESWERLYKRHTGLLRSLKLVVERKDLGQSRGVYFRMQAGPVGSREKARALCAKLKVHNLSCIVVRR